MNNVLWAYPGSLACPACGYAVPQVGSTDKDELGPYALVRCGSLQCSRRGLVLKVRPRAWRCERVPEAPNE